MSSNSSSSSYSSSSGGGGGDSIDGDHNPKLCLYIKK
jgi:hypothetical protein